MSTWKKIIISGSDAILNSVTASNGYFGTASFATNSSTASFLSGTVVSASYATTASFATTASYVSNVPPPSTMNITDDNTNAVYYPVFVDGAGSGKTLYADTTTTPISINPNTGEFKLSNTLKIQSNVNGNRIAIGHNAGQTSHGTSSIAIGYNAGNDFQGNYSVAMGNGAGATSQGEYGVGVGTGAGGTTQGTGSTAVGYQAGTSAQGNYSVAIGYQSGVLSLGESSIAIGRSAGYSNQPAKTIIINASGSYILNGVANQTSSFYVAPIRASTYTSGTLYYNSTTNEITSLLPGTATSATSASFATTASYVLNAVSSSFATTATTASYSSQEFVNVETLSADKTLTINDKPIQILNPGGVTRNITLPTTGTPNGFKFEIWNSGNSSDSEYLYVNSTHIVSNNSRVVLRYESDSSVYIKDHMRNISIGESSDRNYDSGVGVGYGTQNNYSGGVGIGSSAQNNYAFGVGVGFAAASNREYGVGVGYGATSNYLYGVGIGSEAATNNNYGVGIGNLSYSNINYGVGVGYSTTSNSKGVGTVVIGAHTKAQRQNEFVTTGTNNDTNKAQSIIQKFRNIALATAAGAFQEIFTDASSGRLTIFASSIYQFRIQINAIEATGFKCKTWEIVGGIKRNASSSTTMMGGAPTYYITSEDSGTSNWDVRVTADDTNEALKIEVKHDSANNVTFSATVWATETRL